jgi:hypothetical protein
MPTVPVNRDLLFKKLGQTYSKYYYKSFQLLDMKRIYLHSDEYVPSLKSG